MDGTLYLCHVIGDLALVVLVRLARLVLGHAARQAVREAVGQAVGQAVREALVTKTLRENVTIFTFQ